MFKVASARSGLARSQVDARLQSLRFLDCIRRLRDAECVQRARAFPLRRRQLLELDVRLADTLIGEGDALRIAKRDAEVAGLRELDDRRVVVAHQLQDLAAHESRNGKARGGVVRGVPVDLLLVERERLA